MIALMILAALPARAFETQATAAWVYDVTTDTVLLEKRAEVPLPPASMSKLMTLYMLFDALRDGRVSMQDTFAVSSRAKAMGGSTMFLNEQDRPTVEELIQGIVVSSGNDATVVVAEGLAGSEATFADQMNTVARQLGMENSNFENASGWPDPEHRASVEDLGLLAVHLIEDFPDYYGYFAQREFDYEDRSPANRFNRNPLLDLGIGADGLKTGHTSEAGYGLVGSAVQGDRRVVFVITGLNSETARAEEAERVVNWAFRQFVEKDLVEAGQKVAEVPVWLGSQPRVDLVTKDGVTLLIPALQQGEIVAEATFTQPLRAPVAEGAEVGRLVITRDGLPDHVIPLITRQAVSPAGFGKRLETAARVLLRDLVGDRLAEVGAGL
jgi:D-alanyl-D-alanine carboxypeptidase (penicillin-binding protein 5/6)